MDDQAIKSAALTAAATALSGERPAPGELTDYASQLVPWITALPTARLDATFTLSGPGTSTTVIRSSHGGTVATTAIIGTNTQVAVNVLPEDAQDNITDENISWTVSDTAGALTASVSADTRTWTGTLTGTPGDVTVTANAAVTAGVPPYVAQVSVVTGPTTHLVGTVTVT